MDLMVLLFELRLRQGRGIIPLHPLRETRSLIRGRSSPVLPLLHPL